MTCDRVGPNLPVPEMFLPSAEAFSLWAGDISNQIAIANVVRTRGRDASLVIPPPQCASSGVILASRKVRAAVAPTQRTHLDALVDYEARRWTREEPIQGTSLPTHEAGRSRW